MSRAMLGFVFFVGVGIANAETITVRPGESLPKALENARKVGKPAIVELAEGRHELTEVLKLTADDHDLVLRGPTKGAARIVGSMAVLGWKQVDPTKPVWEAPLPSTWGTQPITHVFWNGRRLQRARTPNTGWLETAERFPKSGPFEMHLPKDLVRPSWSKHGNVYVVCLQKWAGFKLPIRGVDVEKSHVTLSMSPPPHRQENRNRIWIENAPEALDAPGEWYADLTARVLRIIPPEGLTTPPAAKVTVAVLPTLVKMEGAKNVSLRNLTFAECGDDFPVAKGEIDSQAAALRRGAVQLKGCSRCTIEQCVIEDVGGYAIDLGQGSHHCLVSRCELRNLGAGGVRIGEIRPESGAQAQVHHHTVADCHIHQYGQLYPGAVGLIVFHAADNQLLHNDLHDAPYSGISVGWTWGYKDSPCKANRIEGNHIHHLGGKILSDLGGVYLLGPQPGTIVRRNWIHDLSCFDYGAWGLYTDEGSTGIVLEENLVHRCEKAGFHQHYGRDNIVRGNLIVQCGEGLVRRTREEDHPSFRFAGNIVVSDQPRFLHSSFKNGNFVFEKNLYFSPQREKATWAGMSWQQWQGKGQDQGSLVADPRFTDPAHPEKGFQSGSPATRIGFIMPDIKTIGIRAQTK